MAKYNVRLYFSTFCDVNVEAESRDEVVDSAYALADNPEEVLSELISNLRNCKDPDIVRIE